MIVNALKYLHTDILLVLLLFFLSFPVLVLHIHHSYLQAVKDVFVNLWRTSEALVRSTGDGNVSQEQHTLTPLAANKNPGKEHGQWELAVKDVFLIAMSAIRNPGKQHGQ